MDDKISYRVFYGQVVRFQRLTSHRVDFESRVKFLADILIGRNYLKRYLNRQFCKAVEKYLVEFQKWPLPPVLSIWFDNIIDQVAISDM